MTRKSILNRSFTTREQVLIIILAVLLVGACYYFLVVKNVADTMAANQIQLVETQAQIAQQNALAIARDRMERELEALGPEQSLPEVAVYDNIRNELDELNALLSGAITYDLKFGQPTLTDSLVRRPVTVSFTTTSYRDALDVVRALDNGTYRCDVTDFSLTGKLLADGSVESVSATLNVTYYETTSGSTNLSGLPENTGKLPTSVK